MRTRMDVDRGSPIVPTWRVRYSAFTKIAATIYMLTLFFSVYLWFDYRANKPRVPDPAAGRIYRQEMRGVVVYLTREEQVLQIGCFCVAVFWFGVAGILSHRDSNRVDRQRYVRPDRIT